MTLYIDIGNQDMKFHYMQNKNPLYFSIPTKQEYSVDMIYSLMKSSLPKEDITKVVLCSVVPNKTKLLYAVSKKYFEIQPLIIEYPIRLKIKIDVTDPKSVGSDLIALASFVSNKTNDGIIINMGTATTITHVKNKAMLGTIIIPGFGPSLKTLFDNASQLGNIRLSKKIKGSIGKTTIDAISIGMYQGQKHLINGLIKDIDPPGKLKVFISGGFAREVKDLFPNYEFVKEATIEGMKVIEELN